MLGEYPTAQPSENEPAQQPRRWYLIAGGGLGAIVAVFAIIYWLSLPPSTPYPDPGVPPKNTRSADDRLGLLRDTLSAGTDFRTCDTALKQLTFYLTENPQDKPAPLTAEQRRQLTERELFDLSAAELAEVERNTFTPLDAHYLEMCYLLRDAARALAVGGATPRAQATAAFAWVVRQVRLREPAATPAPLLPPQFVLRRGWGTPAERALIFLALLEQLPAAPIGCVVARTGGGDDLDPKLWACGVVVEEEGKKDVLLFDPRLGLPLPVGLTEVLARPEALKPLTIDDKWPYDVTAERAQGSTLYLVASLSALAPRMRFLQAKLRDPVGVRQAAVVKLADPLETLPRLQAVRLGEGKSLPVGVWRPALGVLRRFLPAQLGGIDQEGLMARSAQGLVPLDALPPAVAKLPGRTGDTLRTVFHHAFLEPLENPQGAREKLLQGRYQEATSELVRTRRGLADQRDQANRQTNLEADVAQWCGRMAEIQAQVDRLTARFEEKKTPLAKAELDEALAIFEGRLKEGNQAVGILLGGIIAHHRLAEITFQLASSKQEEAEQAYQRLLQSQAAGLQPTAEDVARVETAWKEADGWWETSLQDPSPRTLAAAQLNRARVQERLGQRAQALALLRDLSAEMTPLEKTARLYLAQRLEKGGP
jgi:hypothetical protein